MNSYCLGNYGSKWKTCIISTILNSCTYYFGLDNHSYDSDDEMWCSVRVKFDWLENVCFCNKLKTTF